MSLCSFFILRSRYDLQSTELYSHAEAKVINSNYILYKPWLTPYCWRLFFCDIYLQFVAPINLWNTCIDLRLFSKYLRVLFLRSLRSKDNRCWILRLQPRNLAKSNKSELWNCLPYLFEVRSQTFRNNCKVSRLQPQNSTSIVICPQRPRKA